MSLKFNNLHCWLGDQPVLKALSGFAEAGKLTAILGPNGCGKSTLLRLLLGLIKYDQGEILWRDKKVGALVVPNLKIGYLPQMKEIYWPLTCEAIAGLGSGSSDSAIRTMERFGIMSLRNKRIDQVSGGERTLVLLARALRSQPDLIIADEPVAELDPAYQLKVLGLLREETERGAVVLTTMHDVNLTKKYCDHVLMMKDGNMIRSGKPEEIMFSENLNEIFGVAFSEQKGFYAG